MNNSINILEFNKIKDILKTYTVSDRAKDMINKIEPSLDINLIERWLKETSEAKIILNSGSNLPLHSLSGIDNILLKLNKESILNEVELDTLNILFKDGAKLKLFMENKESLAPMVSTYTHSITELAELSIELDRCINNGHVDDRASTLLSKIRKKIVILENKVKDKLNSLMKSSKYTDYLQDNLVTIRGGRFVVPIKREYKNNIEGTILDTSSSGSTCFIEPKEIKEASDELNDIRLLEEKEVYRILSVLTNLILDYTREISVNIETMAYLDFIFAKAKYSRAINGREVSLNTNNHIKIVAGRHPLLGNDAVPIDFEIGVSYRCLVITGPNTGGKTVALKTIGLLTMMAQAGLHVPCKKGSDLAIYRDFLVDIGDGQSIEESLSTFSSHIKNIITITNISDANSLVILDEIGAGTDPSEGMGIATAVLEKLYANGSTILASTHYSEIKEFAENNEGFKNGCMEFDIETLKPLYKLTVGKSGESNALYIALRLGMDINIIERAHFITYKENKSYSDILSEINTKKLIAEDMLLEQEKRKETNKNLYEIHEISKKQKKKSKFNIGDCVHVSSMDKTGIIYELENGRGEFGVMVMKNKIKINHKRLTLYIESKDMYPENYDFDIVFETVEDRKKDDIIVLS